MEVMQNYYQNSTFFIFISAKYYIVSKTTKERLNLIAEPILLFLVFGFFFFQSHNTCFGVKIKDEFGIIHCPNFDFDIPTTI